MTSDPPAPTEASPTDLRAKQQSVGHPLFAVLSGLVWLIGTPLLLFSSAIAAAPFFGETPSPQEVAESQRLLAGAIVCGVGAPAAGLTIAWRARWKKTAWMFGVVLALSAGLTLLGAGLYLKDRPAASSGTPQPPTCQEHSGGDATCPGG